MIRTLLLLLVSLQAGLVQAQGWSYVYIQGDKQIPFYVKLEGEMLPRYSKNYYIIPELEAGPINLQILFQQNQYPAQSFRVLVPENGFRGFLLTRKDSSFALYDIQQRFYLMPGDQGEDHLPEIVPVTRNTKEPEPSEEKPVSKFAKAEKEKNRETRPVRQEEGQPQFIDNLVLDNTHEPQTTPAPGNDLEPAPQTGEVPAGEPLLTDSPAETGIPEEQTTDQPSDIQQLPDEPATVDLDARTAPIINSDCPEPLSDPDFDKLYRSAQDRDDDEKLVAYLMRRAEDNCFSSRQAYFLARELGAESMRYSFLKKVYPRITDQQNFHLLEDHLFRTLEWKSYFRLIQQ